MEACGKSLITVAMLLLAGFGPWPCRAQHQVLLPAATSAAETSHPTPTATREDQAVKRKPSPPEPTGLGFPMLVFPALEDLLEGTPLQAADRRSRRLSTTAPINPAECNNASDVPATAARLSTDD